MRGATAVRVTCYLLLLVVLGLVVTGQLGSLLPGGLGGHVARNSEGLLIALVLLPWLDLVRPAIVGSRRQWPVTVAAALVCVAVGSVLLLDGVPQPLRTLNESFFALAALIPYLTVRRPLPAWGWAFPAVAAVLLAVASEGGSVLTLAETFAFCLLVPLTVDFADRPIVESGAPRRPLRLALWVALLLALPVVLHVLFDSEPEGLVAEVLRYLSRTTEAFIASLLLVGYFLLLDTVRSRDARQPRRRPARQLR
jgi:hypothetical protein